MSDTAVASAVVMPDTESGHANGLKRRGSEDGAQESSKRQRISPGKSSPVDNEVEAEEKRDTPREVKAEPKDEKPEQQQAEPREPRRKGSAIVDEKQRSKRLFGSLLGNLNQPRDRTSKRREEIEARRKAELQRQDDERLEDKNRRTEKLAEQRRKAQRQVDEENLRIRHSNLLNAANFLQTTSEPRLYYRPWELRPDEEDRIEQQTKDAQAQIDREVAELEGREIVPGNPEDAPRPTDAHDSNLPATQEVTDDHEVPAELAEEAGQDESNEKEAQAKSTEHTDNDPNAASDVLAPNLNDNDTPQANAAEAQNDAAEPEEHERHVEDDGDHIVEGDEDTVIY